MAKVGDYGLEIRMFELQSRYYVHFRTLTLGKGMNPFIHATIGWIISLLFYNSGFGIKQQRFIYH